MAIEVFLACTCLKTINSIYLSQVTLEFILVHQFEFPIFLSKKETFSQVKKLLNLSAQSGCITLKCVWCVCVHVRACICTYLCACWSVFIYFFIAQACFTQQKLIPLGRPYSSSQECVLNALFSKTHKNVKILSFLVFVYLCFWVAERRKSILECFIKLYNAPPSFQMQKN